jgi:hypothetical protein
VSLRGQPISDSASLPDGRIVDIAVGVVEDPYVGTATDTVGLELRSDGEVLATLNTVLDVEQDSAARELVRAIRAGLESGGLEPTAEAVAPYASERR